MIRIRFIFSCFVLFSSLTSFSQEGSVRYSHTFYGSSSSSSAMAPHVLYFSTKASAFYMSALTVNMSKEEVSEPEDENNKIVKISIVDTSSKSLYYKDLGSRKLLCRTSTLNKKLKSEKYFFEDPGAQNLNWELKEDFKEISGYKCQKATVAFRGRNYDAWFTTDIPLPYGPWKLGGLPGLILEVYDDKKEISFIAENITIPDPNAESYIVIPRGSPISLRDYVSLRSSTPQRIRESRLPFAPKRGRRVFGAITKKDIEIEYEWSEE